MGFAGRADLRLDRVALCRGKVTNLHEGINEEAQAKLGRQAAGGYMRSIDQPEMLKIAHHIADGRRRQ